MAPKTRKASKTNIVAAVTTNASNMPNLSPQISSNVNLQNNVNNNIPNSNVNFCHNFHTPLIPIQKFDGNAEQVDYFIQQLKQVAESSNWPDTYTLAYARTNLTGKALKYVNEVEEIKKIRSSEELFEKLLTFFKKKSLALNFKEWENLKMSPKEPIRSLAHRINLTYHRAFPQIEDETASDRTKFYKLIKVLPSQIRLDIFKDRIETFEEAVERAITLQDCIENNDILDLSTDENPEQQINTIKIDKEVQETIYKKPYFKPKPRIQRRQESYKFREKKQKYYQHQRGNNKKNFNRYENKKNDNNDSKCQLCYFKGHQARQCRNFKVNSNSTENNSSKAHPN